MKPVAVLGVGPAGLMAAHAVALSGRPVSLFGKPGPDGKILRSRLGGAQFLHDPLPLINDDDPDVEIMYRVSGNAEIYKHKVYGSTRVPFVSFSGVHDGKVQPAWNLQATYDRLWEQLSADSANVASIDPAWLHHVLEENWFSHILSTIPLPAICETQQSIVEKPLYQTHLFVAHEVRIAAEAMAVYENTVTYDGTMDHSWYRTSNLFGVGGTEYGASTPAPPVETFPVRKPIATNCNCFSEVVKLGRYGTWTKGVLTHHAFFEAAKVVGR